MEMVLILYQSLYHLILRPNAPLGMMDCQDEMAGMGLWVHKVLLGFPGFMATKERKGAMGHWANKGDKDHRGHQVLRGHQVHWAHQGTWQQGTPGLRGPPGSPAPSVGGVTYNRWGNSNCRSGAERVYAGRTGYFF